MMTPSMSLLIHIAGLIAVSQLIFSGGHEQNVHNSLNGNMTGIFHGALERVVGVMSSAVQFSSDVGWLLKVLLYSAATLYILYIGRLVDV